MVADVLDVRQFTQYGSSDKCRRPSCIVWARHDHAEQLVDRLVGMIGSRGAVVATGRFRTQMRVEIVNDGPVTLLLEV